MSESYSQMQVFELYICKRCPTLIVSTGQFVSHVRWHLSLVPSYSTLPRINGSKHFFAGHQHPACMVLTPGFPGKLLEFFNFLPGPRNRQFPCIPGKLLELIFVKKFSFINKPNPAY